jgi:hypothetical protein
VASPDGFLRVARESSHRWVCRSLRSRSLAAICASSWTWSLCCKLCRNGRG